MTDLPRLPRLGDDVHYVAFGTPGGEYPKACRAAKITDVEFLMADAQVTLFVMNPSGVFFRAAPYDAGTAAEGQPNQQCCGSREYAGGSWHWGAE